jgi:hypothetical protein
MILIRTTKISLFTTYSTSEWAIQASGCLKGCEVRTVPGDLQGQCVKGTGKQEIHVLDQGEVRALR